MNLSSNSCPIVWVLDRYIATSAIAFAHFLHRSRTRLQVDVIKKILVLNSADVGVPVNHREMLESRIEYSTFPLYFVKFAERFLKNDLMIVANNLFIFDLQSASFSVIIFKKYENMNNSKKDCNERVR